MRHPGVSRMHPGRHRKAARCRASARRDATRYTVAVTSTLGRADPAKSAHSRRFAAGTPPATSRSRTASAQAGAQRPEISPVNSKSFLLPAAAALAISATPALAQHEHGYMHAASGTVQDRIAEGTVKNGVRTVEVV